MFSEFLIFNMGSVQLLAQGGLTLPKLTNQDLFIKVFESMRRNSRKVESMLEMFLERHEEIIRKETLGTFLDGLNIGVGKSELTRFCGLFDHNH